MNLKPFLLVAMLTAVPAAQAATNAHATLEPQALAAGQQAQLSITVDDAGAQPPDVHIANAHVRYAGQMSNTTIINGTPAASQTFLYTVVPDHAGTLDVPAISVPTSQGAAMTAPLHATVTTAAPAPTTVPRDSSHAFVRLEVPKRALVVGEAVPVKIRAYFRGGTSATLEGAPKVDSDAFTLSQLSDKPSQAEVDVRGERYLVATWTGVLAAAKPIAAPLAVELPVELAYRVHTNRPHRTLRDVFGDDPFADDPFASSFFDQDASFDDLFDEGTLQQEHVQLKNAVGTVTVSELPAKGKPASFTGAVGQFALAVDPVTGEPRVGEPLTLQLHVTGTGNFDRVALAGIPPSADVKTYDLKSSFSPGTQPLAGDKTFTQTIVPTRAGALTLPAIELAYFDPHAHAYATAHTQPIALQVAPSAATGLAATVRDPAMAPNRLANSPAHPTLSPLAARRGFWALPAAIALITVLLAAAGTWQRSQRRTRRARHAELDRGVEHARRQMQETAARGDAAGFFAAARTAFQLRLAARWDIAPEAVTTADIAARIHDPELVALLEHGDRITYAGTAAPEPLERWHAFAEQKLAHLEAA